MLLSANFLVLQAHSNRTTTPLFPSACRIGSIKRNTNDM